MRGLTVGHAPYGIFYTWDAAVDVSDVTATSVGESGGELATIYWYSEDPSGSMSNVQPAPVREAPPPAPTPEPLAATPEPASAGDEAKPRRFGWWNKRG